jgi:hypothetical protein
MQFERGSKVWTIVAGDKSPGRVVDADRRTRQVVTKTGALTLTDAIEVISLRKPTGQDAFYTRRAESMAFVAPRDEHVPAVDGPVGADTEQVLAALETQAAQAMLDLQRRRAAEQHREVSTVDWSKVGKTALTV